MRFFRFWAANPHGTGFALQQTMIRLTILAGALFLILVLSPYVSSSRVGSDPAAVLIRP
jgi:hypothetical protein